MNPFADLVFDPTPACSLLWLWQVSADGRASNCRQDLLQRTAMLASHRGINTDHLLPPRLAYVGSFGPFYLELRLKSKSARNHRPNANTARAIN